MLSATVSTACLSLGLLCPPAPPQGSQLSLVADLNSNPVIPSGSLDGALGGKLLDENRSYINFNGDWYFSGSLPGKGSELLRTDGTTQGTQLVKDIRPGLSGSGIAWLTVFQGSLYFAANDGVNGTELWRSDGTEAGTTLVRDIRPGPAGSTPYYLRVLQGALFFRADDGVSGAELWRSDGTYAGTQLLLDIAPGSDPSFPAEFVPSPVPGQFLFRAFDWAHGSELWRSDGTAAGTLLLKDIDGEAPQSVGGNPVNGSSGATEFRSLGSQVLFRALVPQTGFEIWTTDGTPAGTQLVKDAAPGTASFAASFVDATVRAGVLYFGAGLGAELWRSDGTAAGTYQVADLNPGPAGSFPSGFITFNGQVYFGASNSQGNELWKLDANEVASQVIDLNPGFVSGLAGPPVEAHGRLWFAAQVGQPAQPAIASTTGTGPSTIAVSLPSLPVAAIPDWLTPIGANSILFDYGPDSSETLWRSDGTGSGTSPVPFFNQTAKSSPRNFLSINGRDLFFVADDGIHGLEPWYWTPESGAVLLADIAAGQASSSEFTVPRYARIGSSDLIFFRAWSSQTGDELWVTDGTPLGTRLVRDIRPGVENGMGSEPPVPFGDAVFFWGNNGTLGAELWTSDGTAGGTRLVKDIRPGPASGAFGQLVAAADSLWMAADDGINGVELWRSDGTTQGTLLHADLLPGPGSSSPNSLIALGHRLCCVAQLQSTVPQFLLVDQAAQNITPLGSFTVTSSLAVWKGRLFFGAAVNSAPNDRELWVSDLTPQGTLPVLDLVPGPQGSDPAVLVAGGTGVYFWAKGPGDTAPRLWLSDGTPTGTVQVSGSGQFGAGPSPALPAGAGAYFLGSDAVLGPQLYFSPAAGQPPVAMGSLGYSGLPGWLSAVGGDVLFSGDLPGFGVELLRLTPAEATVATLGSSASGAQLSASAPILGQTMQVRYDWAEPGQIHLVFAGLAIKNSLTFLTAPGSGLWVDPANAFLLTSSLAGSASLNIPLSANPGLSGLALHVQALTLGLSGPPIRTSNGLRLSLRP